MYELKIKSGGIDWNELDVPGVEMALLRRNETSGAMTVLTRIAPGAEIPAHRHTSADESVFVVEGDFVEDGEIYGPGSYFFGRAGTTHGPHRSRNGCVVLTHFSAELDFVPADQNA